MHPSLEQLLDFRDGEAPAPVREHVASCRRCAAEVERLSAVGEALRALPETGADRDCWPALRAEALALRRRRMVRRTTLAAAAAAAVVAIVGTAVFLRQGPRLATTSVSRLAPPARSPSAQDGRSDLAGLIRQSQQLESLLRRVDSRPGLQSGREAAAITSLQDQVALVDGRIAQVQDKGDPAALAGLWRQRVRLLDALVEVQVDPRRGAEI